MTGYLGTEENYNVPVSRPLLCTHLAKRLATFEDCSIFHFAALLDHRHSSRIPIQHRGHFKEGPYSNKFLNGRSMASTQQHCCILIQKIPVETEKRENNSPTPVKKLT